MSPPRVYTISVTAQPGTQPTAPASVSWITEDNTIVDIELEIPPGHNGLTGIRIIKGDVQLVPWSANSWIIANDYVRVFPVGVYLPTNDVTIQVYNTGAYPHTFYLRMTVTDYNQGASPDVGSPSQAIPSGSVTAAPDPLSPDAILGPVAADQLATGQMTADELAGVQTENLTVPPQPVPTGL